MRPTRALRAAAVAATVAAAMPVGTAQAAEEVEVIDRSWPTDGVFGHFDRAAVQRGFQVFKEVCHSCHSLAYVAFRNLAELGYDEAEVRAIAADFNVQDGPNDAGEMFERPARPSDRIPSPFPNPAAARAANNGALPPDLSLMTEARSGAEDYVYSLLVGYEEPPPEVTVPEGLHYNKYYPGHFIAMPPPLSADQVTYADGTAATVEQMSSDVTEFMTFAAEPNLEERKRMGMRAMLFLVTLTGIMYAYKRKIWSDVH